MKNLKLGAKILLGFGIVIALMFVNCVVVIVANSNTITNVKRLETYSELQTKANALLDDFDNANTEAHILYNIISDEATEAFRTEAKTLDSSFDEVLTHINQYSYLSPFLDDLTEAQNSYQTWHSSVEKVIEFNNSLTEERQTLTGVGKTITEVSDAMFNTELARAGGGTDLLAQTTEINRTITLFRLDMRTFIQNFDITNLDTILANMDKAMEQATAYQANLTSPEEIQRVDDLIAKITNYREHTVAFGNLISESDKVISAAIPLGDNAANLIRSAVELMDQTMAKQVQSAKSTSTASLIIVIAISLISMVASLIMAFLILRSITEPVKQIVAAADALAEGDVSIEIEYESKDELGTLVESFKKMMNTIRGQVNLVGQLAEGDVSFDVPVRSSKDAMNIALQGMTQKMNQTFEEIRSTSSQVSSGAQQIAQASTNLATGSTEQAATIQEFNATIYEIHSMADNNSQMAAETLTDVHESSRLMEECTQLMNEMIHSMQDINEKSQSISKVIKVIDDIAFQTNILALNAAVEAARAGQHGKGFAVVADEVRNLASKSAVAAKETAGLIEQSVESVEEGNTIVARVNESIQSVSILSEKNAQSISSISDASLKQKTSIAGITEGMSQISHVVQANSATAEETAASSEEMSAQATMLDTILSRFKLRNESDFMPALGSGTTHTDSSYDDSFMLDSADDVLF